MSPKRVSRGAGDSNSGLRVLRSRAEDKWLRLLLEGLAGHEYTLRLRSPKWFGSLPSPTPYGTTAGPEGVDPGIVVQFEGEPGRYVRREVVVSLSAPREPARRPPRGLMR